ncbi:hypothetical protein GCM10011514_38540 [Emticicia aquatilis]|uniref:Secretion system C-terminal sorting domain-containing protein n=1 Tax=Emticicia aquatilis TaxID=1537369 RepID=A0A917DV97_9BACT|nr:zinc-dependent metalloprotease [Emticicia aquatilis]GGD70742.1 hypothetical protein GCM10011514_38540 [Emticicia aquatilis]
MKATFLILVIFLTYGNPLKAQTIFSFEPNESLRINDAELHGKIKQIGSGYDEIYFNYNARNLHLIFKPSKFKQYTHVLNSTGKTQSELCVYEAASSDGKYYMIIRGGKCHSISFFEGEDYFSLESTSNNFFVFTKNVRSNLPENFCGFEKEPLLRLSISQQKAVNGCFDFPVAFVVDYEQYKAKISNGQPIADIEADNLSYIIAAQEVWAKNTFEGEVRFRVVGQKIYTNLDELPWPYDLTLDYSRIAIDFDNFWKKPEEWKSYKLLTLIGITGLDFFTLDKKTNNIWGYGLTKKQEYKMGVIMLKGLLPKDATTWLLSHELGHVFGAVHDDNRYVMNPFYDESSLVNWSPKSKEAINSTLNELNDKNWLKNCPEILLSWSSSTDTLLLEWKTNYDDVEDMYSIEKSQDGQKTWQVIEQVKSSGKYNYQTRSLLVQLGTESFYYRVNQKGRNSILSNSVIVSLTSVNEENLTNTFYVYPNPVGNILFIKSDYDISIHDSRGNLHQTILSSQKTINTSNWPSGIYFITENGGIRRTVKIVK